MAKHYSIYPSFGNIYRGKMIRYGRRADLHIELIKYVVCCYLIQMDPRLAREQLVDGLKCLLLQAYSSQLASYKTYSFNYWRGFLR